MKKIKKGDKVQVMRGKQAGSQGEVLKVVSMVQANGVEKTKVVVKGINVVKKHQKPIPTLNIPGGIVEIEKPIDISNVMLVDPKSGKPTRVGIEVDSKTGKKYRVAKKSGTKI